MSSISQSKNIISRYIPLSLPMLRLNSSDIYRLLVLIGLGVFGVAFFPGFVESDNLFVVLNAVAGIGILALSMTLVIITGEIDLSIAGIAVLSTVIGGLLLPFGQPVLVIGVTLFVGLVLGLINGILVAVWRISSLITTLGMLGITSALANIVSRGQAAYPTNMPAYLWFGRGEVFGFPVPIALFISAMIFALVLTQSSTFGRKLYATGGNLKAAELSGVKTRKVRVIVFAISGFAAALVGIMESARLGYINPAAFSGLELRVLAVAVLGGAVLSGGVGSVTGAVIATLIIGCINNLLNQAGVSFYLQQVVTGLVILAVVTPGFSKRSFVR